MSDITSVTVLTAADAANQLQSKGLDALGLTMPAFGTLWSTATTTADDSTLRLAVTDPRAPFTGTFHLEASPVTLASVSGDPITSPAGVLRLHPEAVHRLESVVRPRYGALQRPVPVAMVRPRRHDPGRTAADVPGSAAARPSASPVPTTSRSTTAAA